VNSAGLVLMLALGGGLLALWVEVRWPQVTPRSGGARVVHVLVSLALVQFVVPPALEAIIADGANVPLDVLALLLIFLPGQVYAFLSAIWLLKSLRALLQPR
jgi:hypothetical protein